MNKRSGANKEGRISTEFLQVDSYFFANVGLFGRGSDMIVAVGRGAARTRFAMFGNPCLLFEPRLQPHIMDFPAIPSHFRKIFSPCSVTSVDAF
jgi:hypothetical protein